MAAQAGHLEIVVALLMWHAEVNLADRVCVYVRTDGWMEGERDGWMDGWMVCKRHILLLDVCPTNLDSVYSNGCGLLPLQAGMTALMHAAAHGRDTIVELLLRSGVRTGGLIHHLSIASSLRVRRFVCADMAMRCISEAVCSSLVCVVWGLRLCSGAAVDRQNKEGRTALIDAARNGKVKVVERLLRAGAKIAIPKVLYFNHAALCSAAFVANTSSYLASACRLVRPNTSVHSLMPLAKRCGKPY